MAKAILELEMPESCWQCELYSTAHNCCNVIVIVGHYAICPSKGRRPDCPLKLVEEKEVESGRIIDRLAAYEDSGLSPEEVQDLAKAKADGRLKILG